MMNQDAKPSGPWWHSALLAVLFFAGAIQWIVDPPVDGLGRYVLALVMLGIATTASRTAWTHFGQRNALQDRGPEAEQIP